jgi:hypothetical protein
MLMDVPRISAKMPTTKIRVLGETWSVPRGFGAAYRRVLKDHFALLAAGTPGPLIAEVIDLLALVGYHTTIEQVAGWDLRRRVEAVLYAGNTHARASDNPVPRYPRPSWLPERPWQGPVRGKGVFAGPSGTSIGGDA